MSKLNVKGLMKAISGLEAYKSPIEEHGGVQYLYDMLYTAITNGVAIRICDIDYSAFTLDDIEGFENYFDNTISERSSTAYYFSQKLRRLSPIASKTRFI